MTAFQISTSPLAPLEEPLLDAEAARAGDRAAVESGDTWLGLMERAAGHLARAVVRVAGHGYGLRVVLIVGKGDNGGDGWAAARRLTDEHGVCAWVVAPLGIDTEASEATENNRHRWLAAGGRTSTGTDDLDKALAWADVAVDCMLGTGAAGAPRGLLADAAAALNLARAHGVTVVACDIPTGVSADDGSAARGAVVADATVTFGGHKRGLVLHPGCEHAGQVIVGDLGPHYRPPPTDWRMLTHAGAAPPVLAADADKRQRGRVAIVAGSSGMSGAAVLAAHGALRTGAGLVHVYTDPTVVDQVAGRVDPGVMVAAFDDANVDTGIDAAGVGPGLGPTRRTRGTVEQLGRSGIRLVLDADAINVFRDDPDALIGVSRAAKGAGGALVITPHARELARIGGGTDGADAWDHRVERVPQLARDLDAVIVAKGPSTIVAAPDGRVWVCPRGGPQLGSGGTGDVLAGMIAAAIVKTDDIALAVARAVYWHAVAGELASAACGPRPSATDVLRSIGSAMARLDTRTSGALA